MFTSEHSFKTRRNCLGSKFLIAFAAAFGVAVAGARPALDRPVRLAPAPVVLLGVDEVKICESGVPKICDMFARLDLAYDTSVAAWMLSTPVREIISCVVALRRSSRGSPVAETVIGRGDAVRYCDQPASNFWLALSSGMVRLPSFSFGSSLNSLQRLNLSFNKLQLIKGDIFVNLSNH